MRPPLFSRDRGDYAEQKVCEHFLSKGYRVLHHQKKIFGVEFDWIFEGHSDLVYVEVKSVKSAPFFLQRWPLRQRQRFTKVASILAEQRRSQFYLALVDYEDKIHLFRLGSEI